MAFAITSCETDDDNDIDSPYQADKYEPNDSQSEAASINLETNINATIYPVDDEDYFVFTTTNTDKWDRVEVSLTGVSEDLRASLRVYDSEGVEVFTRHAPNSGANITETFNTEGGTYYVRVSAYISSHIGQYTLNVKNLDHNDEYAPNDELSEAYDLGILPASDINGIIASNTEEDWFKFTTENDGVWDYVKFDLTDVCSSFRARMRIYNENGKEIGSVTAETNGQSLGYTLATNGGTYYVRIFRYTGTVESGEYTLNIANLDANDDYAPNDTRETAYNLGTLPQIGLEGKIILGGEEDWYEFTTINDNPIVVNLTSVGENLRASIRLTDGTTASNFTTGSSGSDIIDYQFSGIGSPSQAIEEGKTYYFRVSGYLNSNRGEYTLSIEQ